MPWKYTDDYYREYTRTTWNESAEAYVGLMRDMAPFRTALLEDLAIHAGESVLDLGTGPGEPALTMSRAVGEEGRVLGVDLSERMIDLARASALSQGAHNVEFRTMDSAALALPDGYFDAATCCFGFQIFTDPEQAARETFRVLRADGRIGVTVWGTADKVPFIQAIIGPMLEYAEPDETGYLPTPYETGGPGEMAEFLRRAGFQNPRERAFRHELHFADEEGYLQRMLTATPIGHSLSEESAEVQSRVLQKTRDNLGQWRTSQGLSIPGECLVVIAEK